MTETNNTLEPEFSRIREQLQVPSYFPEEVVAAAQYAAENPIKFEREDKRHIPFITIDPPESRDLDQAFFAERDGEGYRVYYAISDVASFVERGSPIEAEALSRGVTLYSPDIRTPLYPQALCENAGSLLPNVERPAIIFTFSLTKDASETLLSVRRGWIQSRAKLGYPSVGEHLRAERESPGSGAMRGHDWSEALTLLEEIGRKRQLLEVQRGGVSLQIKTQHVQRSAAALMGYRLILEVQEDIEGWNAQISLMTGMAAAALMRKHNVGLLRVLDPPREDKVAALRLTARTLQVPWADEQDYVSFIRSLDPKNPIHTAVMYHATTVMGGARYESFMGEAPPNIRHAAIAAFYAHVTAPLRRLADRYVLDLLVELSTNGEHSHRSDLTDILPTLPEVMSNAERRAKQLEAAMVDFAEAKLLAHRTGESFDASIIKLRNDKVTVQLKDPPVRADMISQKLPPSMKIEVVDKSARVRIGSISFTLGDSIRVKLVSVELNARTVTFLPVL
jgi:VacB/RNase II family 3'-5' exoribonuclease